MAKRSRPKPKPYSAYDAFVCAQAFGRAAASLSDRIVDDEFFVWPMVVNQAFCLEVHLKCLRRIRRQYSFGHDAHAIFDDLSKLDQAKIKSHLKRIVAEAADSSLNRYQLDIESILLRNRDTFMTGRYWFEGILPSPDLSGDRSNAGTDFLTEAVLHRILELRPTWKEQIWHTGFKFGNSPLST